MNDNKYQHRDDGTWNSYVHMYIYMYVWHTRLHYVRKSTSKIKKKVLHNNVLHLADIIHTYIVQHTDVGYNKPMSVFVSVRGGMGSEHV